MELRQLGNDDGHQRHEIDDEVRQVVMRVVRAEQKQHYGHRQKEFLCWSVLVSVVNLFPHVEVVVRSRIEFEGHASDVMEHEVGSGHVCDIGQRPRNLLSHSRHDIP